MVGLTWDGRVRVGALTLSGLGLMWDGWVSVDALTWDGRVNVGW